MDEEPHRRRRRPALSCLPCRRRKIKCDRVNPCGRCVSTKTRCTYRMYGGQSQSQDECERDTTSSDPGTYATPPVGRTQVAGRDTLTAGPGQLSASTPVAPLSDQPNSANDHAPDTSLQDIAQRLRKLEEASQASPIHSLSETGRHILTRQAGIGDSEICLKKTRLLRWSDWMGVAPEFSPVYKWFGVVCGPIEGTSFLSDEAKALVGEIGPLYDKCKRIAKSLKVNRPSRCLPSTRPRLEPPPRQAADTMATTYFRYFEPMHRILHEPTFWSEYQLFWDKPESVPIGLRLKILLVIGIGSSVCEEASPDSELRNMVQQWVYTAQAWLSGPLEKDRLDVSGMQVNCLTIIARQIFSIGGDLVWVSMGSLVNRAMQIGINRDPKHLPKMPILQAEVRRRLWYTILELLVQSSLDSAMPPRVSYDDFDTEPPSNNNDDEINESTTTLQPHPRSVYTSTAIQLQLIDSLPTRLRTVQLLNGLHSGHSYSDVLELSLEITQACQSCRRFALANKHAGVTSFKRNMCDYMIRRFLIPLHCPFASEARANPLFYYSQKAALDAALAFISPEPDERFSLLMARGGGMFREGFRYAAATITLELLVQAEAQRNEGTLHHNRRQLDFLRQAVNHISAMSWERIRQGETNIKGPMFIGVVLAIADAVDKDALREFSMAKNARDALLLCLRLLETRANALGSEFLLSPNDASLASSSFDGDNGFLLDLNLDFFFQEGGYV